MPVVTKSLPTLRATARAWLAAALASAALPALAAGTVEIVSPKNRSIALGAMPVEVRVTPPADAGIQQVQFLVDGQAVAGWTAPPFRFDWDSGDSGESRVLTAVAEFSDGTVARAVVVTSKLRINQVEKVNLVNLYVLVRDRSGRRVTDLTRDRFVIEEDDTPQSIERFSAEPKPLSVGIVLDTSLTMRKGGRLETAQRSAVEFLNALEAEDHVMLVTFSDDVRIVHELTPDRGALAAAIRSTVPQGGTALYDALYRTANRLDGQYGRRVLVLLTDGRDEAASGLEPGSLHTLEEALSRAQRADVMVFAIGLGKKLYELDFYGRDTLESILTRVAASTGGRVVLSSGANGLKRAFREVEDDLRHQYTLAYRSTNQARDGSWRKVEITIPSRPELEVIAREGYYAAQPDRRRLDRAVPVRGASDE